MNPILFEVFQSPGYSNSLSLNLEELEYFKQAINSQWLEIIIREYPEHAYKFQEISIPYYHKLSHLVEHNKIWNKINRCLPKKNVQHIKSFKIFDDLRKIFGEFNISSIAYDDKTVEGEEEIYWRLVRPNVSSDVGTLHADKWFHDVLGMHGKAIEQNAYTIKVWIPIYCEPGKNGLMIVPDSHTKTWSYKTTLVNGLPKPILEDDAKPQLILTQPGSLLIFPEETLHGGIVNTGSETRVSVEITLVFKKPPYKSIK